MPLPLTVLLRTAGTELAARKRWWRLSFMLALYSGAGLAAAEGGDPQSIAKAELGRQLWGGGPGRQGRVGEGRFLADAPADDNSSAATTTVPQLLLVNVHSGSGDSADDLVLVIVFSILGSLIVAAACSAAVVVILHRRHAARKQFHDLFELDQQEQDFEDHLLQLSKNIELYTCKFDLVVQDGNWYASWAGQHNALLAKWESFRKDSQKFVDCDYTPGYRRRSVQDRSSGITHTVSGVCIADLTRAHSIKGVWPALPATPAKEIKRQFKELNSLDSRLHDIYNQFQQLRKQVFPEGLEALETIHALSDREVQKPILDPKVEEEVALIRTFAHPLLCSAVVKPYGVLGATEGSPKIKPSTPLEAVVVDPAGWPYIGQRNNPKGACGVSLSIYDWLGLTGSGSAQFPQNVHDHFSTRYEAEAQMRARFHSYDQGMRVVHAISPRVDEVLRGLYDLSGTYLNILTEFCQALERGADQNGPMPKTLRLMPLSGGAKLANKRLECHTAEITWSALSMAFAMLPPLLHSQLEDASIEVCVFRKSDAKPFEEALEKRKHLVSTKPKLSTDLGRVEMRYGNYDWVRQKNAPIDRLHRLNVMLMTKQATCSGGYQLPDGKLVELHLEDMLASTCFTQAPYNPTASQAAPSASHTRIVHSSATVMEAAIKAHNSGKRTVAVNAASAYSVGGGVLTGGRHALEETWCTMSTLLSSLQKVQWEQLQVRHSRGQIQLVGDHPQHIPVDGCIVSPGVEIFRDTSSKGYPFQTTSTKLLGVCSVAMFNMNPRVRDSPQDAPRDFNEYCRQIKHKFVAVLAAADDLGAEVLVCPDAGCGVFENDPLIVGSLFGEVVRESPCRIGEIVLTGKDKFFSAAARAAKGEKVELRIPHFFDLEGNRRKDSNSGLGSPCSNPQGAEFPAEPVLAELAAVPVVAEPEPAPSPVVALAAAAATAIVVEPASPPASKGPPGDAAASGGKSPAAKAAQRHSRFGCCSTVDIVDPALGSQDGRDPAAKPAKAPKSAKHASVPAKAAASPPPPAKPQPPAPPTEVPPKHAKPVPAKAAPASPPKPTSAAPAKLAAC